MFSLNKEAKPTLFCFALQKDPRGVLGCFEFKQTLGFNCKRIYYLLGNESCNPRGFHAHKTLQQIMFCVQGHVRIEVEDRNGDQFSFTLNNQDNALYVPPMCWREIYPLTPHSNIVVLASDSYSKEDYIHNKSEFHDYCVQLKNAQAEAQTKLSEQQTRRLKTNKSIDLAHESLSYEAFRCLSSNNNLSKEEKIGFPDDYRLGYEKIILDDISSKLTTINDTNKSILDIGCGCGGLSEELIRLCGQNQHQLYLVDSQEMLDHLPDKKFISKIIGMFPENLTSLQEVLPEGVETILCYSVFQYAFVDTNPLTFIDAIIALLKPGGVALIGDIPNYSKRKRFFSSDNGKAFHQSFINTNQTSDKLIHETINNVIDDLVLQNIITHIHAAGCDAYLMPQNPQLPMANRRDDLLIRKP